MNYDVIIIGGGPGGSAAAKCLGRAGKKVVLISDDLGGECLNYGCIPTKTYLWTAELFEKIAEAETYGIELKDARINWKILQQRKIEVVSKLKRNLRYTLEKSGVEVIEGKGTIEDTRVIKVSLNNEEKVLEAKSIILATGSEAIFPKGFEKSERILNNREILDLPEVPKTLLIIGGGAVGVEFASVFSALGTKVTIAEIADRLLPTEDHEVSAELEKVFVRKHIAILKNTRISPEQTNDFDKVLVAAGRRPSTAGFGLEKIGVKVGPKGIETNEYLQTNLPHLFAIGDLAGKALLAYTAEREGEIAAECILGGAPAPLRYECVPNTIFSLPEVASVGRGELNIQQRGLSYVTGKGLYSANAKALIFGSRDGFAKIIADATLHKILGIHIIGEKASELIAEASLALQRDLTLEQLYENLHSHPILGEVLKEACGEALRAARKMLK